MLVLTAQNETRMLKHEIYELKLMLLEHKDCPLMAADIDATSGIYMTVCCPLM